MSFHLRHSRNETAGFATVLVMIMISVVSALALTYSAGLIRKNQMQLLYNKDVRKTAILNSVISMALQELKLQQAQAGSCSLKPVLAPSSTAYKVDAPRVFGKGLFQIPILRLDAPPNVSNPLDPSVLWFFFAPETDPQVWIEAENPESSGRYKLNIKFRVCDSILFDRTPFPKDDDGLAKDYNIKCPAGVTYDVSYTGIINTNSWASIHTVYIDRGFFTNTALSEPTLDQAVDKEEDLPNGAGTPVEQVKGSDPSDTSTEEVRRAGSTHDQILCPENSRSATMLTSLAQSLKEIDPCGKVAVYEVGGNPNEWGVDPTPGSVDIRPSTGGTGLANYIEVRSSSLNSTFLGACRNFLPGGAFSYQKVLEHYIANHQPDIGTITEPADRNKRRNLIIVSDGSGYDPMEYETGLYDITKLRQTPVFYTGDNCTGTPLVETATEDPNNPVDYRGAYLLVGDDLYEAGGYIDGGDDGYNNGNAGLDIELSPPPSGGIVVRSAQSPFDGSCRPILGAPGTRDPITNEDYTNKHIDRTANYYVIHGQSISKRTGTPKTGTEVYEAFRPIDLAHLKFTNTAQAGLREYPQTLEIYPLPIVDLDEQFIADNKFSGREFLLGNYAKYYSDTMATVWILFFKWIDARDTFKGGIVIDGLTPKPQVQN